MMAARDDRRLHLRVDTLGAHDHLARKLTEAWRAGQAVEVRLNGSSYWVRLVQVAEGLPKSIT